MLSSSLTPRVSAPLQPLRVAAFRAIALLAFAALLLTASTALAKPKVHTVYSGQRLGSIAQRYNVTVDELCQANGISRRDPIHPGQKLVIPGTDDGSRASKSEPVKKPEGKARIHTVERGHTLSAIAGRYAITVTALCHANDLSRRETLTVGRKLVIPHKTDEGGRYTRKQLDRGEFADTLKDKQEPSSDKSAQTTEKKSWEPYVKPAWRRGYIKIRRYGRYWEGYVIGPKNEVLGHASNKINFVLGAKDDGPRIDPVLIRLIASVSDKFGGRELRIVSGYRTKSFVAASKHKEGKALDFSIPGVPNEALRDYLRTVDGVGVGYYPNSSFIHVDVRGYNSYWIDYSGPGEAPRRSSRANSKSQTSSQQKGSDDEPASKHGSETDDSRSHDEDDSEETTNQGESSDKDGGDGADSSEAQAEERAHDEDSSSSDAGE